MIQAGELEPGESFEEEGEEDLDNLDSEEEGELEIEDDTMMASLEEEKDLDEGEKEEMEEGKKEEMKENEELEELRKELQEVNLLNSKLLYANKIFRTKNLQEHQKRKVLESFDEAQTVKEAKLVYETLISTLNAKPATKTRKPIRESIGRASSPINSLANKTPIVELAPEFVRMQELAGIKKVN